MPSSGALSIESLDGSVSKVELHNIYISLIDGLCKMGELDFYIEMQILMVEKGMAPDVFTYISLIHGLSDSGLLDEAGLLDEDLGSIALMEV